MEKKIIYSILTVILLMIGSVACTRSFSSSPKESPQEIEVSTEVVEEMPASGTEVMGQIFLLATQTAMAQQGIMIEELPEQTPTEPPLESTETEEVVSQESPEVDANEPPTEEAHEIIVPTPTPGKPEVYVLQKGEFPFCIARRFDVNPHELMRVNNIPPNTTLQPGTKLTLPKTDRTYPGSRTLQDHPTTYVVKEGETIYAIACIFGDVDPNAIIYANNLEPPYELVVGQELYIP